MFPSKSLVTLYSKHYFDKHFHYLKGFVAVLNIVLVGLRKEVEKTKQK